MSTLLGMLLSDRYRLDAQIGAGGMSTVYRAFDVNLERRVAIKLLHREMSGDSDQLERFRREARAVAQLSHPHIVGVIDAGEDEGRPYIVFEYVDGETLKDRIRRLGRLPIDESLAYAIEIARALGCAHQHDIVHRDVKPQNVLLDPEGSAKVTDFGIARSLRDDGLTADGRVLGTTDYVSPEQALGHDVDGQSDIYSLGVVLFEMLTGDVPFHGENQISVAMKHVREDLPDIQRIRPEVSATTAAVLDRMTDKDLAHRYDDVTALVADLEDALAIEAARSGTSTGEATAVIRTLPARTQRRLPFRMRHSIPLLAVLVMVETTDVVFAVDSVPAIFGVAHDPFIVFSSNAFAILGLRALYFLLGGMQDRFRYLNYGLGGILGFVGVKMLLTFSADQFEFPSADFHVPTFVSLGVIFGILALTIVASLIADKRDPASIDAHMPGEPGTGVADWMDGDDADPTDDQPVGHQH
jgi:serine/threonine-protein kinase